jgi:transcription-repair coupling factor (superfamily II helicase)
MKSHTLFSILYNSNFNNLINSFRKFKNGSIYLSPFPLKAIFTLSLIEKLQRKILIITKDFYAQQDWFDDITFFNNEIPIFTLSESLKAKKDLTGNNESLGFLVQNISNFKDSNLSIAISTPDELGIEIPSENYVKANIDELKVGMTKNYNEFIQELLLNGFSKTDYVASEGDISIRGSIIDFFPIGLESPIRIEFFGDEIESIREFDPLSQRSIKEHTSISYFKTIFNSSQINSYSSLFDYLPKDTIILIDTPDLLDFSEALINQIDKFQNIKINPLIKADYTYNAISQPEFNGSIKELVNFLIQLSQQKSSLIITSDNKNYTDRLKNLIYNYIEEDEEIIHKTSLINYLEKIKWDFKPLSSGFISNDYKLAILTEHQIFDRKKKISTKHKTSKTALSLKEINSLQIGDYIVHEDKGIGIFDGLQTLKIGGILQDCVRIKFQDDDILYLNLNYINKIDRYSSADNNPPKLSKLGSPEWERRKARLKKKLKDISRELITLYAKRKASKGYSYPLDSVWQKEFESSFMYEDTIDQSRATDEVKKDMQEPYPMDRLICGDVGFGKTEIAIRAAFKAATAGKQVAVLVPTTILAQQHFMTFKDRLNRYPINITMLSRFRSQSELKESISKIKEGKIDIVIGTHRLLSSDIQFKDLGLLIIDEEHRFGVSAKEKLRTIKENVETLTMTATPIPRTLNFSLLGVRDISVIETPPPNRLPVYTEVVKWNKHLFREVLLNELNRNGQAFFVSDKVYNLDQIAAELQSAVPEAKFGIAHGQMKPTELEQVMEQFVSKKFDVLVTTKIIESGLDIPNANTIFINQAQNFGLAELYQLRGRVGRNNLQAYCYLFVPNDIKLPEKSIRRLQALEEFTDLGSGLKLAMRDMEIRGTGNLLGAEQSGFIEDIGFELYSKILEEAVQEIKQEEFSYIFNDDSVNKSQILRNTELEIDFDQNSYIPDQFIPSDNERYSIYKRLYSINNIEEVKEIEKELIDRFGQLPFETENLLFAIRLRVLAMNTGFRKISIRDNNLQIEFPKDNPKYYEEIFPLILDYINTLENVSFKQVKSDLRLKYIFNEKNDILEFMWKIKKIIDLAFSTK